MKPTFALRLKRSAKRIGSLLLGMLLAVNLFLPVMAAWNFNQSYDSYEVSCEGKALTVTAGEAYQNGYLLLRLVNRAGKVVTQKTASAGKTITVSTALIANGFYYLELYTGTKASGKFTEYAAGTNTVQIRIENGYTSQVITDVWTQNLTVYSNNRTDSFALQYYTAPSGYKVLKNLAAQLTADCDTQLQKIKAIHDWITANLYYDYTNTTVKSDVVSAYKKRYTDAQGYANLTAALLRDAGIPAKVVSGYVHTDDSVFTTDTANAEGHHWNEAYDADEKRWVILDTCWDGANSYENGKLIAAAGWDRYFDPTLEAFSIDHLLENNEDTAGLKKAFQNAVNDVKITYSRTTVYTGEHNNKAQIDVTLPQGIKGLTVKYGTSNKNKVAVNKKGELTGTGYGKVNITVKVTDGTNSYSEKQEVRCYNPFLKFKSAVSSLKVGKSYSFAVSKYGVAGTVQWKVSDNTIAVVSKNGKLTAKKSGTVTLTATVNGISISQKVKITK